MTNDITSRAEAFLFMEGGSLTLRRLRDLLEVDAPTLNEGLRKLSEHLKGSGLTLVVSDTEATLAVSPEASEAIKKSYEREAGRDIGDAGLEVLAIVLYRGPSTRAQIDYIRGVNTSSTIRALLGRGLLERVSNPEDAREYLYRPTTELLAHLGVERTDTLPEHTAIHAELAAFEQVQEAPPQENHGDAE